MSLPKMLCAVSAVALIAGCSSADSTNQPVEIGKVFDVKSVFGPEFKVVTAGPTGIDPKLLSPQKLPEGLTFEPPDCAQYAAGSMLPQGLKGNIASVTAEGQGNRFIVIAVETSEPVAFDPAVRKKCRYVTLAGGSVKGVVDVVDAPPIEGAETVGTHQVLEAVVAGKTRTGELYNYVAYLGDAMVVVTGNPLVIPNQPVAPVDIDRAKKLLVDAVAAVRG